MAGQQVGRICGCVIFFFPHCGGEGGVSVLTVEVGKVRRLYAQTDPSETHRSEYLEVFTARWDGRGNPQRFPPLSERAGE